MVQFLSFVPEANNLWERLANKAERGHLLLALVFFLFEFVVVYVLVRRGTGMCAYVGECVCTCVCMYGCMCSYRSTSIALP